GAEPGAHRRAVETLSGKPLPQQAHRTVVAEISGEIGQRVAAHPENAAGAVAVAEHGLGGDQALEPAIHSGSSGSFSRSVSDRKHSTGCSTEGRCRRLCGVLQGRSTMQAARLLLHGEIRIKPLNSLARRAGDGRLGGAAATAVEGALLVVPG